MSQVPWKKAPPQFRKELISQSYPESDVKRNLDIADEDVYYLNQTQGIKSVQKNIGEAFKDVAIPFPKNSMEIIQNLEDDQLTDLFMRTTDEMFPVRNHGKSHYWSSEIGNNVYIAATESHLRDNGWKINKRKGIASPPKHPAIKRECH